MAVRIAPQSHFIRQRNPNYIGVIMKNGCCTILFAFILFVLSAMTGLAQEKVTNGSASSNNSDGSITRGGVTISAEKAKPVKVPRFETVPTIDGKIEEDIWKQAHVFKDFIQIGPGDNIDPSKQTEVLIGYDSKTLYLAFRCFDEKDKVRATVAKRDGVFGEDNVRVFLDTFNDERRAFMVGFNPLGIQADGIYTEDQGTDFNFDLVMESKGILTDFGWSVEAAIPFKSLRYQAGKDKLWGIHIWRNIDRFNDEIDSWMPISRNISGMLNQAGKLTGLEGISTERTLEIIPSLTLKESGERLPDDRILNSPIQPDLGLTVKYSITSNITLDAAINPDFADVEADGLVVAANQRFPIFFSEKRPFFLEGVDIFKTPIQAVHTRTIVDPDIAAKLTGKIGKNTFGFLYASDRLLSPRFSDPNATVTITRLKRDIGKESSIGFLGTTRNFLGNHNYLGGFDGRFKLNSKTLLSFQALGTNTKNFFYDPELDDRVYRTGNGFAYNVNYDYTSKLFGYQIGSSGRTRDYRADVGFTRRRNNMSHYAGMRLSTDPKPKATIIERSIFTSIGMNNDFQGRIQSWGHDLNVNLSVQHNIYINVGYDFGYERIFEEEFGAKRTVTNPQQGAFFGGPERSTYNGGLFAGTDVNVNKKFSFYVFGGSNWNSFDFDFGAEPKYPRVSPAYIAYCNQYNCSLLPNQRPDPPPLDPGTGRSFWFETGISLKPTDELSLSLNYDKSRLRRNDTGLIAFDSNIFSARATYQFTRFVYARAIVDYDTLSAGVRGQYLFGWTPNPGTALYIGYNDDSNFRGYNRFTNAREQGFKLYERTFFIKMSYLFRKSF
jgi:opacity protein-like surface antigen